MPPSYYSLMEGAKARNVIHNVDNGGAVESLFDAPSDEAASPLTACDEILHSFNPAAMELTTVTEEGLRDTLGFSEFPPLHRVGCVDSMQDYKKIISEATFDRVPHMQNLQLSDAQVNGNK